MFISCIKDHCNGMRIKKEVMLGLYSPRIGVKFLIKKLAYNRCSNFRHRVLKHNFKIDKKNARLKLHKIVDAFFSSWYPKQIQELLLQVFRMFGISNN